MRHQRWSTTTVFAGSTLAVLGPTPITEPITKRPLKIVPCGGVIRDYITGYVRSRIKIAMAAKDSKETWKCEAFFFGTKNLVQQ